MLDKEKHTFIRSGTLFRFDMQQDVLVAPTIFTVDVKFTVIIFGLGKANTLYVGA